MKTQSELESEARQLMVLARERLQESPIVATARVIAPTPGAKPLFTFSESVVRSNAASEHLGPLTHRMIRSIDAVPRADGVEFRLFEEEIVSAADGQLVSHRDPAVLETNDDALEILETGYRRFDEDRLRERLEPVINRLEAETFHDSPSSQDIAEIEQLVADLPLSTAGRMRLRADARDMLEGNLEPDDFVARTVARQNVSELRHERIEERNEMKLAISHI